jgi:hypothetical protein
MSAPAGVQLQFQFLRRMQNLRWNHLQGEEDRSTFLLRLWRRRIKKSNFFVAALLQPTGNSLEMPIKGTSWTPAIVTCWEGLQST